MNVADGAEVMRRRSVADRHRSRLLLFICLSGAGVLLGLLSVALYKHAQVPGAGIYLDDMRYIRYAPFLAVILLCWRVRWRGLPIVYLLIAIGHALYIELPLGETTFHRSSKEIAWFQQLTKISDALYIASSLLMLLATVPLFRSMIRSRRQAQSLVPAG